MSTYRVTWEIDVVANSVEEAAHFARQVQQDPLNIATCFKVQEAFLNSQGQVQLQPDVDCKMVDLLETCEKV